MIIGHDTIKKLFSSAIRRGNLAHAYLFSGSEGLGKKYFALELVKSINKSKIQNADFKILEGDESIGIGEIRDLKRFFSFKPYMSPWKIAVIDDAHRMTVEAQNAFLKLLEEPTAYSLMILISNDQDSILDVIKSRCQVINFKPVSSGLIENSIYDRGINTEDAKLILNMANGRIGYAMRLVEGESMDNIKKAIEAFKKLQKAPLSSRFTYAKKLIDGGNVEDYLYYWIKYLRNDIMANKAVLQKALTLNSLIKQSKFNKRLALENFLIHV